MDEKLQKFLANRGYGSRRQVEQWISDGRVRLNNSVAKIGDRVSINDSIFLDNKKFDQENWLKHTLLFITNQRD